MVLTFHRRAPILGTLAAAAVLLCPRFYEHAFHALPLSADEEFRQIF